MEIEDIQKILPHRYPFLLIDRVNEIDPNKRIVGIKNITFNESFFQGHFPGRPVMPGVLIIEAMAQIGGILVFKSYKNEGQANMDKPRHVYFMSIERAKFRKPVVPGDQLRFEVEIIQQRGNVWKFKGNAFVNENLVSEAEFTAMVVDKGS
ncbi:MAG: 3-hydroxyacyl-ACP dehydratase FabZ [Nitrospirota bacterium]